MTKSKTFKREVGVGLMLGFCYVVYTGDHEMVKVLVWPVFSFAALAFGMDWYGKVGSSPRDTSGADGLQRVKPSDGSWR